MKGTSIAIGLAAGFLMAGLAAAQPYGMGPGMMGYDGGGPWMMRWGVEDPCPLMRRYFRCSMCGTKGCVFERPLVDGAG